MNPLTTTQSFSGVFPSHILTYISDRSIDFTLGEDQNGLSDEQLLALKKDLDLDVLNICNIRQVHEEKVIVAAKENKSIIEADGIITDEKDLAIVIRTADCLSVFLYDQKHNVIGLVHCGWKSTRLGIINDALDLMREKYKTQPEDIIAAVGPGIRSCHYEVGKEFIDFFPEDVEKRDGLYYVDLATVNIKQLLRSGCKEENIHDSKICTMCSDECFSYRRDGEIAGRMLSLMMIKP